VSPSALEAAARDQETYVRAIREALHRIPELRFEEQETLALIRRELDRLAGAAPGRLQIRELEGGLVADLDVEPAVDPARERLLFRADVDGLPVPEGTGLPYASIHPGKMHACGHDAHAAMLLGALRALMREVQPAHHLRFVWQRAEENPITESGGAMLVREGVCDGVDRVYGLHVDANAPAGRFGCRPGPYMANSDRVRIEITCQGGHVARPHHGSNAADIAVDVCVTLRGFPLRVLGPLDPVSFVPAVVRAGSASNVRPDTAELWFAARNFLDAERRAWFHARLREEIEGVVRRYADAHVTVTSIEGHPSLVNTPGEVERVQARLRAHDQEVAEEDLRFGGEDFAWYLRARPGCFWFLGVHQAGSADHHAPRFNPDPAVFWRGVHYWLLLATDL
jgi:amidohydrolase